MSIRAAAASALVTLAFAASAEATTYHAANPPAGTMDCSSVVNACSLTQALLNATSNGDEVLLEDDTFPITAALQVNNNIRVAPRVSGTFPKITNTAGHQVNVTGTATLEFLDIEASGLGAGARALDLGNGTGLGLLVVADGASAIGVEVNGGTLADSGVLKKSNFGSAVETGPGGDNVSRIRNVTAANTGGTGPDGLLATPYPGPASNTVEISNSILLAQGTGGSDIRSFGDGAANVTVNVDHSNFDTPMPQTLSTINDLGGNQTALPILANVATGSFNEVGGSPTIDAGARPADLSLLDWDTQPRCMGANPDIGADEFAASTCTGPASAAPAAAAAAAGAAATTPKKKCKRKKKRRAAAAKKCKRRKR